jgi:hypothetical protein
MSNRILSENFIPSALINSVGSFGKTLEGMMGGTRKPGYIENESVPEKYWWLKMRQCKMIAELVET